jgi:hypothetical protein
MRQGVGNCWIVGTATGGKSRNTIQMCIRPGSVLLGGVVIRLMIDLITIRRWIVEEEEEEEVL